MRKPIVLLAALALVLPILATQAVAGERVALVIGNAAYRHTLPLRNPRNDAADMARVLRSLSFQVIEGLDLDKAKFEAKLREFARAARGAEAALFFYAGHGLQVDGENYLVPVDAKLAEEVDLDLEAFELRAFLKQMRSSVNLVFLDACRDNPLAQDLARSMGATRSAAVGRGLGRVDTGSGTLIAYATQPGNVAADGKGRNSPFTGAVLAHIATPDRSVNDLMTSVANAVVSGTKSRQQPWTHSSLTRPFYFATSPKPVPVAKRARRDEKPSAVASGGGEKRLTAERLATERLFWESVKDSRDPTDFKAYLDRYPRGAYAALAANRQKRLKGPSTQPTGTEQPMAPARGEPRQPVEAPEKADVQAVAVTSDETERVESPGRPARSPDSIEVALGLDRDKRRRIQRGLASLGFGPGPADGVFGQRTRTAIGKWQSSLVAPTTGYLDAEAAKALLTTGEQVARRFAGAAQTLAKALASANKIEDAWDRSRRLGEIAEVQTEIREVRSAESTFSKALQAARDVESRSFRSAGIAQLAARQAKAGNTRQAAQLFSEALDIARGRKSTIENYEQDLALFYVGHEQVEAGNLRDALRTVEQIEDAGHRCNLLLSIALAQVKANAVGEAGRLISQALEAAERFEDGSSAVYCLAKIAEVQAKADDLRGANRSIVRALQAAGAERDFGRSLMLSRIAASQAKIGDASSSMRSFTEALAAAERLEWGDWTRDSALESVVSAQASVAMFRKAWSTVERIGDEKYKGDALASIARAKVEAGDIKSALTTASRIRNKDARDSALSEIAEAQAEADDFREALTTAEKILSHDHYAGAMTWIAREQAKAATTGPRASKR